MPEIDQLQQLPAIFIHYISRGQQLDEWIFIDDHTMFTFAESKIRSECHEKRNLISNTNEIQVHNLLEKYPCH